METEIDATPQNVLLPLRCNMAHTRRAAQRNRRSTCGSPFGGLIPRAAGRAGQQRALRLDRSLHGISRWPIRWPHLRELLVAAARQQRPALGAHRARSEGAEELGRVLRSGDAEEEAQLRREGDPLPSLRAFAPLAALSTLAMVVAILQ